MSQMTSTSFHENTMAKEPMDAIPIVGRSQQKNQTSPAVNRKSRAASAKNRIMNIFVSPFFCNYILADFRKSVNCQIAQNLQQFFNILHNKTKLGAFCLKTRRPRFYPRAACGYWSRAFSALVFSSKRRLYSSSRSRIYRQLYLSWS